MCTKIICMLFATVSLSLQLIAFDAPINEPVKFSRVGLQEGLSQSSVFSLYQDYLGFMWIGTRDGLNRYDARDFTVYRSIPSDSTSLSNNYILSLLEDSKQRLWVGTNAGINLYDRNSDHFIRISVAGFNSGNDLSEPAVLDIVEDRDGRIWFGTNQGLFCWDDRNEDGHRLLLAFDPKTHDYDGKPLGTSIIRAVYQDGQENLWLGTTNGVIVLRPYRQEEAIQIRYHFQKQPGQLNSADVRCIQEIKTGCFWK